MASLRVQGRGRKGRRPPCPAQSPNCLGCVAPRLKAQFVHRLFTRGGRPGRLTLAPHRAAPSSEARRSTDPAQAPSGAVADTRRATTRPSGNVGGAAQQWGVRRAGRQLQYVSIGATRSAEIGRVRECWDVNYSEEACRVDASISLRFEATAAPDGQTEIQGACQAHRLWRGQNVYNQSNCSVGTWSTATCGSYPW